MVGHAQMRTFAHRAKNVDSCAARTLAARDTSTLTFMRALMFPRASQPAMSRALNRI
jgi:hypothetical protein